LLVDRDEESAFGGLARESFGGMFFVDSPEQRRQGIRDSIDLALRDWCSFAEFGAGDHWPRAWAETYVSRCSADVYPWVRRRGVSFLPVVNWVERGEFHPGNSVPRFHVSWGTGKSLTEALIDALRGHRNASRLTLQFNRRVERLTMAGGKVDGASGLDEKTGVPFEVKAEQVVIAAGGINGGDLSRVRQNWHRDWCRPPETLLSGSHRFADASRRWRADASRPDVELRRRRAPSESAQAVARAVAGAAALGAVAELAGDAHRATAAGLGL